MGIYEFQTCCAGEKIGLVLSRSSSCLELNFNAPVMSFDEKKLGLLVYGLTVAWWRMTSRDTSKMCDSIVVEIAPRADLVFIEPKHRFFEILKGGCKVFMGRKALHKVICDLRKAYWILKARKRAKKAAERPMEA